MITLTTTNKSKNLIENLIDASGNNANGDYSSVLTDFSYVCVDNTAYISELDICIQDSSNNWNFNSYGKIDGGLTNGVKIYIQKPGESRIYINPNNPIKKNADWEIVGDNAKYLILGTDETLFVKYHFNIIKIRNGESMGVELNDDLSGLVNHIFTIKGYKY